jgi:hypothetical protein
VSEWRGEREKEANAEGFGEGFEAKYPHWHSCA